MTLPPPKSFRSAPFDISSHDLLRFRFATLPPFASTRNLSETGTLTESLKGGTATATSRHRSSWGVMV
ncbi:unnamed protein product [Periconia digitata]|uniref:Uncharacterized protein n=1 Tax=Periconia digitata TaxID=1303443 RepID=A0A9W4URT4_9PLEO|nr:unnamed protein product [Periconia digitata]